MEDNKKNVEIDGVEYDANNFTNEQIKLFNHVVNIDGQLNNLVMQTEQVQVAKNYFLNELKNSLKTEGGE